MKKNILLLLCLFIIPSSFASNIQVIVPTLEEGALYNYWWMDYDKKKEAFKKTNLYSSMLKRGLNFLKRPKDEKIWSEYKNGAVYYYFFTNIAFPISEKFLIQRIKKVVRFYKKGQAKPYKEEYSYLVEAFKTWTGYAQVEGTLKRADGHDAIFSNIGKNRTKVVFKEFETGVGTIDDLAEDSSIWPFDKKTLYFGTKYDNDGKKLYNKVKFSEFVKWTLNVEVNRNSYLIESPELNLYKKY